MHGKSGRPKGVGRFWLEAKQAMGKLAGKVVAVTGASSGIGREVAIKLGEAGAVPVLLARRKDKLEETAGLLGRTDVLCLAVDVTDGGQVECAVKDILAAHGRIDGWVNNAGAGKFQSFLDMPLSEFERMIDLNYMALVRCIKAVLPRMLEAGSGVIVNVASVAGKIGTAKSAAYSASKHAAIGLTTSLRAELAGTGVKVCAVNPGPVDTPFFDLADPSGNYVKNVGSFMIKPDRVARAVLRALETGKADITLPLAASWGAKLMQAFPNQLSGIAAKLLDRK
jgi:hypothetical protein